MNTDSGVKCDQEFITISSPREEEEEPQEEEEEEEEMQGEEEGKSSHNSNPNPVVEQQQENMEIQEDPNQKKKKKSKNKNKNKEDGTSENGVLGSSSFPASRINRIIRSEAADLRITQESIFLINKATEKFLGQFCEDVYANVAREKRKAVSYKHVSSAVSKVKRYDFLSDFVPEKIKAEDALSERLAGI